MAHDQETRQEVPKNLSESAPKTLGFLDQGAFWGNLGVSLLGFSGALTVLAPSGVPKLSILAAIAATVVGTVLGSAMVGLSAVPGARTGAPAMVLLRGLFGTRLSFVPTALNILQLVGWGTFELLVIAQGAQAIFRGGPHWLYVLLAGIITTALTIRPLGAVRLLRRYVTVAVAIALVYFLVQFLRHPLPPLNTGSWSGFWAGADAALAVAVSWIPVASDYSRHSRSSGKAFSAATIGYSFTQIVTYLIGLIALAMVSDSADSFGPFIAIPLGALFFGILVIREVDQSFANVYSTAVSIQNLRPLADRRVLSVAVGLLTTILALSLDIGQYANFLTLIGSVFVPLFGVLAADYFLLGRHRNWDISAAAPSRWGMFAAWLLGFVAYQLISPAQIGWWSDGWSALRGAIGFSTPSWASASLGSVLVAAVLAWLLGALTNRDRGGVTPADRQPA